MRVVALSVSSILIFTLIGCASVNKKQADSQIQQLQTRISELEQVSAEKDKEINSLQEMLANEQSDKNKADVGQKTGTVKMTAKRIQAALKNAGFYKGPSDGKIGKNTKDSIKDFQKANGLNADGIVGRRTWLKLQQYLK